MQKKWAEPKEVWMQKNPSSEEISDWAMESLDAIEKDLESFEKDAKEISSLKEIKRIVRSEIASRENTLDNLSLNPPNSYKLQVSIPSNINYLLKAWAASEGRDLSSVALQCLELGLREMKGNGSIPTAAVRRYNLACEKRIALAEINGIWERYTDNIEKELN